MTHDFDEDIAYLEKMRDYCQNDLCRERYQKRITLLVDARDILRKKQK